MDDMWTAFSVPILSNFTRFTQVIILSMLRTLLGITRWVCFCNRRFFLEIKDEPTGWEPIWPVFVGGSLILTQETWCEAACWQLKTHPTRTSFDGYLNCRIRLAIIKVSGKPEKSLRGSPSGVHTFCVWDAAHSLSVQLAGWQLDLMVAPGKNLQILPDAQAVQLLAGEGFGAHAFGGVADLGF